MHRTMVSGAVLGALALAVFCTAARAQRAPDPTPLVILDASVGLSLRETPLTFTVADVIPASLRLRVPLNYGLQPWVAGALAHVRGVPCDSVGSGCSSSERQALIGLMYQPSARGEGRGGGPYLGVGLGVRQFRGARDFAHSIVLGLPFAVDSPIAPSIELRSESYRGFGNELLIVAVGVRVGLGG